MDAEEEVLRSLLVEDCDSEWLRKELVEKFLAERTGEGGRLDEWSDKTAIYFCVRIHAHYTK
jgi:hypothetical protein